MLRIALPNKGRLADGSRELLEMAGLQFDGRGDRALQASLGDGVSALFVNARDIPEFVADGAADLGITGADLVAESGRPVETLLDLRFGQCRLAVAAREDGPIATIGDVPDGARVATVFPRITTGFFQELSRAITLVPISGAAENAPHLGVAEVIVDVVSTGSTLKMNGLREIATVMTSAAVLVGQPAGAVTEPGSAARDLVEALESVVRARGERYLMANVPRAELERVKRVIPGISGPTIIDVLDGGEFVAAHAVVHHREVYRVISQLKALGATGILVTKIERLMP